MARRYERRFSDSWAFGFVMIPITLLMITVLALVLFLLGWAIAAIASNGAVFPRDVAGMVRDAFFPGGLPTPFFWFGVAIVSAITLLASAYRVNEGVGWTWLIAIVLILASIGLMIGKGFTAGIIASDYYLKTTQFVVADPDNPPAMLKKYVDNGSFVRKLETGDLPTSWVPRVASATGATNVMTKAGDAVNNTQLMPDTVTYLYGEGDNGKWTAIRNGVNQREVYGVASWNGTGDRVDTCRFVDDYALNKSFGGIWQKNLWDSVAGAQPSFYYNESDMWGYCDGEEPIIVIPGVVKSHIDMQSADQPGGVLTIRGSKSGEPVIELKTDVKPGEFPGPVYAQRLVDSQRNALDWAAGYFQSVNERFGFDTTNVDSQTGNSSNFLMKSRVDDRLYWVNPMKPQFTDSQTVVAYSMIPADEVSSSLNKQTVYVLGEEDPRVVNLDDMLARVTDAVRDANPGFFTGENPGKIVEFLPVSDTTWQVFAEVQGRVKYRIDVDVDARVTPQVVDIDSGSPAPTNPNDPSTPDGTDGQSGDVDCNDPSSLTNPQLASCLQAIADELESRKE